VENSIKDMEGKAVTTETKKGWGFPSNSKKAHYFVNGMSLCHKYGFYRGDLEDFNDESNDNCTACKKALLKIRAKEKVELLREIKKIDF